MIQTNSQKIAGKIASNHFKGSKVSVKQPPPKVAGKHDQSGLFKKVKPSKGVKDSFELTEGGAPFANTQAFPKGAISSMLELEDSRQNSAQKFKMQKQEVRTRHLEDGHVMSGMGNIGPYLIQNRQLVAQPGVQSTQNKGF